MLPIRKGDGTGLSVPGIAEVRKGDGTVLWSASGGISNKIVSLYEYEDDSDTTVAIDSIGNNDANINGASYSSDADVGSLAIDHDGTNDTTRSQNTIDLVSEGDTTGFALAGHIKPNQDGSTSVRYPFGWGVDGDNFAFLILNGGTIQSFVQVDGSNSIIDSGVSVDQNSYTHAYIEVTETEHRLKIDGTQQASATHGLDPSLIGTARYQTGIQPGGGNYYSGLVDDFAPADDPLTDTELNDLISRSGDGGGGSTTDPHLSYAVSDSDVITAANIREGFYVIRAGAGDWHGFIGAGSLPRDMLHFTSSDGVTWSADSNNPVINGSAQFSAEDPAIVYDGSQWVMFAEDDDTSDQRIWSASSLDASVWTFEDIIPAGAGFDMHSNFNLFDGGSGIWHALSEERDLNGPEYGRHLSNSGTLTNGADWVDNGRATIDGGTPDNVKPVGQYQFEGNIRWIWRYSNADEKYTATEPANAGDYSAWVSVGDISVKGSVTDQQGYLDSPVHDSDGWSEYYPNGESTPWMFSWYSSNKGGDDNIDLLKGGQ
jgi:hypothetical protein